MRARESRGVGWLVLSGGQEVGWLVGQEMRGRALCGGCDMSRRVFSGGQDMSRLGGGDGVFRGRLVWWGSPVSVGVFVWWGCPVIRVGGMPRECWGQDRDVGVAIGALGGG